MQQSIQQITYKTYKYAYVRAELTPMESTYHLYIIKVNDILGSGRQEENKNFYIVLQVSLSGLDELEALKAVTINAAKLCHIDDKVGSIKEGKDADIVIWDRHPLDIMCKPNVVILNGKVVNQATIMLPFYVKKHYN